MKYDDIEVLDLDVRTYNDLKRAGINTIADIENQAEKLEKTIPSRYKAVMDRLSEYKGIPAIGSWVKKDMLGDELTFDDITNMVGELIVMDMSTESHEWYKVERVEAIIDGSDGKRHLKTYDGSKQRGTVNEIFFDKDCHNPQRAWRLKSNTPSALPSPAQTDTAVAVFDYSELDPDTAAKLENVTAEIFNVRKEYIFTMAKKVAYAHDLLANCKNGMFGAWCASIGISRDTGNNLVNIAETFGNISAEEQKNLSQLKPSLLYEASRPSAPPELVEQVKSGDITTHKEYIALKKELEAAEEQNAVLNAEKEQFHRASKANLEKLNEERERNSELEQQIRELESRPVDVMVQTDADAERKFNETIRKINLDFEKFRDEADKDLADMRNQRNKALDRAEAAEAQLNDSKAESNVKSFVIRMTMDDYDAIIKALSGNAYLKNIIQKAQVLRV